MPSTRFVRWAFGEAVDDRDLTSFCGLWCGDCIPACEELYALTARLERLLNETGFENYAAFKAARVPEFKDYSTFIDVLNAFEKLHCHNYCRQGPCSEAGCARSCKIRICAIDNGYEGCWECGENPQCAHIESMAGFHPDIRNNLKMIAEHGMNGWKEHRGRHYHWST